MHRRVLIVALGLIFVVIGSVKCEEPHDLLTDEEFYKIFRTTRDEVPEYEVVPIMHNLHKRSTELTRVNFTAFGRSVEIHLDPIDGNLAGENTPVWKAFVGSDGKVNYKKYTSNITGSLASFFLSSSGLATLLVDESKRDSPSFSGIIDDLYVEGWPARVIEITNKRYKIRRDVSSADGSLIPTDYHVVIKSKRASLNKRIKVIDNQVDQILRSLNETDGLRNKRRVNEVIHPSILVVTDYSDTTDAYISADEPETESWSFRHAIVYQLAFWNSVDLRFRTLEHPKIRLRIAGIVIGTSRAATPYIHNNMRGKTLDAGAAFYDQQKYWAHQSRTNPDFDQKGYHMVVTLTNAKMYLYKDRKDVLGLAALRSLCQTYNDDSFYPVSITYDNRKYDGILTATHELGHIFGAQHDESRDGECAEKLGYIMTPAPSKTVLMNRWSPCSTQMIERFLSNSRRNCANEPAEYHKAGNPIDRAAPGDYLGLGSQCDAVHYNYACNAEPKICKQLQCWNSKWFGIFGDDSCQDAGVGALDGTRCSSKHPAAVCVSGECRNGREILE